MAGAEAGEAELWIFGYGSLIWKVDFPYAERREGYITGWERGFWQGSPDHRGTPEALGRVVTLLPLPDAASGPHDHDRVTGVAYRIHAKDRDAVIAQLDHREKGGFSKHVQPFWLMDQDSHKDEAAMHVTVYVADPDNQWFLGKAPIEEIAETISTSRGPSGPNHEYLLRLVDALDSLGGMEPEMRQLGDLVRPRVT